MLQISEVRKQISSKLEHQNNDDLIMQSFLLGMLYGESRSIELFQQHFVLFQCLNRIIKINIYNYERIYKIYNDTFKGSLDLKKLQSELDRDLIEGDKIQQTLSFIQNTSNNQSEIFFSSQQNQGESKILQSQWEILQQSFISQSGDQSKHQQSKQFSSDSVIYKQLRQNQDDDSKSLELAYTLQQQFIQEYQQNLQNNMQTMEKLQNNQIQCKICLENISHQEQINLYCSHIFHQDCLNQHCLHQMKSRKFPIQCPGECQQTLIKQDLTKILDDQQLKEFEKLSFKSYIDSQGEYSWCPTPDCKFYFVAGKDTKLDCPVCKKSYCLVCQIEYHNGFSCKDYQDKRMTESKLKNEKYLEERFFSFIKGTKCKQCPQCKMFVEKSQGCNHMTCRCKFQFCYVCGGVYQKCECVKNGYLNMCFALFSRNR